MEKTLVKSKIVLNADGKGLIIYMWRRVFLCFGYWYPFGSSASGTKYSDDEINEINDDNISHILFENFLAHRFKNKIK